VPDQGIGVGIVHGLHLRPVEPCFIDFQNRAPKECDWELFDSKAQSLSYSLKTPIAMSAPFVFAPARIEARAIPVVEMEPVALVDRWCA